MIGTSRANRATMFIARMSARQGGNTIRLLPPVGTGGTYSSSTMTVAEVPYTAVGPLPAVLREVADDERKGGRRSEHLAGDNLATGTATIALQAGIEVDTAWRIEVAGAERPIVKVDTRDYLKVWYS